MSRRKRINLNQVLPSTPPYPRRSVIREQVESVDNRMRYYKSEHYSLLQEATIMRDFSLWKTRIEEYRKVVDNSSEGKAKKTRVNVVSAKKECRTYHIGASIVIKNSCLS